MPANIRISAQFPFPATVQASAPITLGKANGVYTVGFSMAGLAVQTPPAANYPTDFLIVYDSITKTFFRTAIGGAGTPFGRARVQRSVVATPIVAGGTDEIINCNINVAAACALPTAASRNGLPLTFKDVGAKFAANNLTITPNGAETIDGAANLVLSNNRQGVTLVPFNDGVNSGWAIE